MTFQELQILFRLFRYAMKYVFPRLKRSCELMLPKDKGGHLKITEKR